MRKWRPPDVSVENEWAVKHQIVIPKSFREEILSMVHKTPLSGHMGVTKTCHKILNYYYWFVVVRRRPSGQAAKYYCCERC